MNNYIESWHHQLKRYYLKLMHKQWIDVMLHILFEQVEPDFRRDEIRVRLDFDRVNLDKHKCNSQDCTEMISDYDMDNMITYKDDGLNKVCLLSQYLFNIHVYDIRH